MTTLQLIQVVVDFGLVVLIWLVQLVIYPSFTYYDPKNLVKWHTVYTDRITWIVLPLMVSQLGIAVYEVAVNFSVFHIIHLALILVIWGNTFLQAVPLHRQIANNQNLHQSVDKLLAVNWVRTVLWSLIFVINMLCLLNV